MCKWKEDDYAISNTYTDDLNITSQSRQFRDKSYQVAYSRDKTNGLVSMRYPSGKVYEYSTYPSTGKVKEIRTQQGEKIYRQQFHGQTQVQVLGGNLEIETIFDEKNQISMQRSKGFENVYKYGAGKNLSQLKLGDMTFRYNFDQRDRLIKTITESPQDQTIQSYTYDENDNRLTMTDQGPSGKEQHERYKYGANSRLLSIDDKELAYNSYGETVKMETGSVLDYDELGRLSKLTTSSGEIYEYGYNLLNERIWKRQRGETESEIHYIYDDKSRLISEYDIMDQVWVDYIWADDRLVGQTRYLAENHTKMDIGFIITDHLGTVRYVFNDAGEIIWKWLGDGFGRGVPDEDVDGDGQYYRLNVRFPGQYYDQESGLHYNWNRYYNPNTGRYLSSDKLGLMTGTNTYIYADQNPIMKTDSKGLYWEGPNHPEPSGGSPFGGVCGPEGKGVANWIPDGLFTTPCGNHDKCYDCSGASQATCDLQFLREMRSSCRVTLIMPIAYAQCLLAAQIYYEFVNKYGRQFYKDVSKPENCPDGYCPVPEEP